MREETSSVPSRSRRASLSHKRWHSTTVRILFKDGLSNDVVKYFVDGKRVHTG